VPTLLEQNLNDFVRQQGFKAAGLDNVAGLIRRN
jgi:hypothetical protein